jgi:hypothetical protein
MSTEAHRASPETFLHPSLGAAGFRMYQAGTNPTQSNLSYGMLGSSASPLIASFTPYAGVGAVPEFTPMQLLKVMSRFTTGGVMYLPYFHLCRELGAKAVDGMIRGKVVDVKWTDGIPGAVDASRRPISVAVTTATANGNANLAANLSSQAQPNLSASPSYAPMQHPEAGASSTILRPMQAPSIQQHPQSSLISNGTVTATNIMSGSTTAVNFSNASHQHLVPPAPLSSMPAHPPPVFTEEDQGSAADVMVPMSPDEIVEQQRSFVQQETPQPQYHHVVPQHMNHQPPPPPFQQHYADEYDEIVEDMEDEEEEVIGPKLFPVSPIMRFAMREVIKEYEDDRSVSEYASLSDVDEY